MEKRAILLVGIIVFVLAGGCLEEIKDKPEEDIDDIHNYTIYNYSTPGFEINQTQAFAVWEIVKFSDDAKFVTLEKNYSVTVFIQSYAQDATEWIVVASSIPKENEDIKVVIFRLDYKTFGFKRSYYFSYPKGKEFTLQQSIAAMEEELKKEPAISQSIDESAVVLHDGNYIYSDRMQVGEAYLFNWDEVPGKDYERLESFLHNKYDLGFQKPPRIEKIDNNKTIRVFSVKNSITLTLDEKKTRVSIEIDDTRTDELIAKMENGKINIYQLTTDIGSTIIFNKYAEKTIFHATRADRIAIWLRFMEPIDEVSGRLIIPGDEINGTKQLPHIETRIESISSPVYRGSSIIAGLSFSAPDYVPNGSEILLNISSPAYSDISTNEGLSLISPDYATNGSKILVDYRTEMLHTDGSLEIEPAGFNIIPEKKRLVLERVYLFSWDEIPGKDSVKLIESLERWYPLLDWLKTAKIEKIDNNRTIRVFSEKDSILLKLNDEKTKIDLRTGIYAPYELLAKIENNKLKIYEKGNGRLVAYSNLTVKTSNASVEGDYFITATARYRGWEVGENVFSFKIGKGGKKSGEKSMTEGSQNIGYSADNPPPLNKTEKAEAAAIAINDPYLKDKRYELLGVSSEYLDYENYSGFFAVVTVDVGDPDFPGEIIRYVIDREERKIFTSTVTPRKPQEYFRGKAFDEANGNFTKIWDSGNFSGFWYDNETNASTELLVINQSILNNNHRIIEKHNLIYTTKPIAFNYQVYLHANLTPAGTDGSYSAIGWQGEKYVYLDGNRLARIIFEQNASEVITLTVGASWNMGDGWTISAQSIDAKAAAKQAWFVLNKDKTKIWDIVLAPRRPWSYLLNNDSVPIFITYFNKISVGLYADEADLKYTWLRSQNITRINIDDTFGRMEVTYIDNGTIELRNKEPIDLSPGNIINLMGNISILVENSSNNLSFHPFRVIKP